MNIKENTVATELSIPKFRIKSLSFYSIGSAADWEFKGTGTTCSAAGDTGECIFKDKISGLEYTENQGATYNWTNAINQCDGLTYAGLSDWRLPTQKELMKATIDGIADLQGSEFGDTSLPYWSSSSTSNATTYALQLYLNKGYGINSLKTGSAYITCVR